MSSPSACSASSLVCVADGFFFSFFSSASCYFSLAWNLDHTFSHFSVACLSFSSLDSLLRHSSASNFSCSVISVGTSLWSFFMCAFLSALTLKIRRDSPQMKMCLSVMWMLSSLLVLNPFTHYVHEKYLVCFASSSAFSFLRSLCSNISSLRLWVCSSCSPG